MPKAINLTSTAFPAFIRMGALTRPPCPALARATSSTQVRLSRSRRSGPGQPLQISSRPVPDTPLPPFFPGTHFHQRRDPNLESRSGEDRESHPCRPRFGALRPRTVAYPRPLHAPQKTSRTPCTRSRCSRRVAQRTTSLARASVCHLDLPFLCSKGPPA